MIKQIYIPGDLGVGEILVKSVLLERGSRIRQSEVLLEISLNGQPRPLPSPFNGWVRRVLVKTGQVVRAGESVMLVDVIDNIDYRPDGQEFNASSELGGQGRRGLEREGQGGEYSAPLFDAPERGEGRGNQLPQNPLMQNMKEGVPPKMQASAANNQPAIDKMTEDASHDPELRQQLSQQLQHELNISPAPSVAPSPRVGG